LLKYKADGRSNKESGITPLYAACFKGHYEVAARLIDEFPKQLVMPVTVEETYPIHAAIINGHVSIINLLMKYRQMANDVTVVNRKTSMQEVNGNKKTPLKTRSSTVSSGSVYTFDFLLPYRRSYMPTHNFLKVSK